MKTNNNNTTKKQINAGVKELNQEYSNLFGCLKAIVALKDGKSELKDAQHLCKVLGLKSKKDVDNAATKVLTHYPLQGLDANTKKMVAFERVTKRTAESKTAEKVVRPITKWTIKKVFACVRVIEGTKQIEVLE